LLAEYRQFRHDADKGERCPTEWFRGGDDSFLEHVKETMSYVGTQYPTFNEVSLRLDPDDCVVKLTAIGRAKSEHERLSP
jgi:hypothetical protein